MEVIMGTVISGNNQQVGGAVQRLLGRRGIVDMGVCGRHNEGCTAATHKLHTWVIETGRFVVNCTVVLAPIIQCGKGIDIAVLLIQQDDWSSDIVHNSPDRATTPTPLVVQLQQEYQGQCGCRSIDVIQRRL